MSTLDDDVWHQSPSKHWFGERFTEEEMPLGCRVCDVERARIGRQIMARFLAFVWCEAEARSDGRQAMFSMHGAVAHDNRAFALGRAISLGLLRVEWPR